MTSIAHIVTAASRVTDIDRKSILSGARFMHIVRARFAIARVARQFGHGVCEIGDRLGQNHTTIVNSLRRADDLAATDPAFARMVERIAEASASIGDVPPIARDAGVVAKRVAHGLQRNARKRAERLEMTA